MFGCNWYSNRAAGRVVLGAIFAALLAWPVASQEEGSPDPPILEETEAESEASASEGQDVESDEPAEAIEPPPETEPVVSQPIDTKPAEPEPETSDGEAESELADIARRDLTAQQGMAESTSAMVVVAWVAAGLTALGVALIWWTLYYTRTAAIAAMATVEEAKNATAAARDAADEAKRQAGIAAHVAQIQLRAYVSVEPRGINPLRDRDEIIGQVGIRNVGARPAANVSTEIRMTVTKDKEQSVFDIRMDSNKPKRTIQPGVEMRQGCAESDWPSRSVLSDNDNYIFVWGVVYYSDGYERRFTHFCHRYSVASRDMDRPSPSAPWISAEKARYHRHGNDSN